MNVFVNDLKINNQIYLFFGSFIFPIYLILSFMIGSMIVLKIIGLKFIRYFYENGIQYLNILDLTLMILDFLLNVTSIIFFILTFSNVSTINYLFFGVFVVLRLLVVS